MVELSLLRPTSVKSNIDNGAYGIFRVSAISEIYFYQET